jgi:hypothetical protein
MYKAEYMYNSDPFDLTPYNIPYFAVGFILFFSSILVLLSCNPWLYWVLSTLPQSGHQAHILCFPVAASGY